MANPYREGKGWAIRAQHQGQEIYRSGFASAAAAKRFVEARKVTIDQLGRPARGGPERTVLAVALSDYAVERLPYLKGARQDAQRINNYLRACALPVIRLSPLASEAGDGAADDGKARVRYWDITLVDEAARPMPNSLRGHRQAQAAAAAPVQAERQRLAGMQFGTICRHHVQALINAMRDAGFDASTIDQERAGLRRLFNHARNVWAWPAPQRNPASGLDLPAIDNRRERVVSNREWDKLLAALNGHRNFYVIPALSFLLHTAMTLVRTTSDGALGRCGLGAPDPAVAGGQGRAPPGAAWPRGHRHPAEPAPGGAGAGGEGQGEWRGTAGRGGG